VIPNYIWPAGASEADHSTYDPMNNIIMLANKEGTDWLDEASQNGMYTEVSLGVNGGSNNTNYAFQAGYLKEEGMLKFTSYERYNLRANVSSDVTKWLEVGTRLGLTYSQDEGDQSNNAEGSVFGWIYRSQPIVPVYDIMGNYAGSRASGTGNARNPLFRLDKNQWDQTQFMRATGNVYAEADIINGLSFKSLFGFNYNTLQSRDLQYIEWAAAEREAINSYSQGNNQTVQWNWSNTLQYTNTFGSHDITALVGTEAIENSFKTSNAGRQGYFLLNPDFFQLDAGTTNQTNSGNLSEWALYSLFGRINYNYDDRYLLEAVVRRDASSRFGTDNNAGVFPAASIGWRISEEEFMSFSDSWLTQLKIRAGYGITGNDRIGNYNSYTTYRSELGGAAWGRTGADVGSYYPIAGGNTTDGAVGFRRNAIGNTAVGWESTTTTNFGFDMTFFDKFDVMLDIWQRNTEDMLYPQQIPAVAGRATAPSINVGEMKNQGFDLEISYNGSALQNELTYMIGLNVSRYKNELVSLSGNDNEFLQGGTIRGQNFTRAEKGSQFPAFFGYTIDGIFQSQEEADAHPVVTEDPSYNQEGVFKIRDVNGDGQIDADDRGFIGSPHPDYTAGIILSASYKGFSLYTNLFASVGNEVANGVNGMIDFNKFQGNRSTKRLYESYDSPYLSNNADATMPMARINDERDQRPSTYFIEDASYLRMQNLRVAYNFNRLFTNKNLFRNLTVYFHSTNLFTITEYSGLDPEIGASGMNQGVDKGGWPTVRRFLFGLQFGL
jgi:TonB-linked SusC/RagA family outer membrane protein